MRSFCSCPDGEDPDDFVRQRGKAAFERAIAGAVPLSEFLLAELAARTPPASAEGRAALVAAARPLLAEIAAPVLAAILRRRLSELSGLPESELRDLLHVARETDAGTPAARERHTSEGRPSRTTGFRAQVRRPPSLARQLIRGLMLQPALAKITAVSAPRRAHAGSVHVDRAGRVLAEAESAVTTAGVLQAFADTSHAEVLASVLATAEDQHLDDAAIAAEVSDGLNRWWQQARRDGPARSAGRRGHPAEENKRVQQLNYVRQRTASEPSFPQPTCPMAGRRRVPHHDMI